LIALNDNEKILEDLAFLNIMQAIKSNCVYIELSNSKYENYRIFKKFKSLSNNTKLNSYYYKNTSKVNFFKNHNKWLPSNLDGDFIFS